MINTIEVLNKEKNNISGESYYTINLTATTTYWHDILSRGKVSVLDEENIINKQEFTFDDFDYNIEVMQKRPIMYQYSDILEKIISRLNYCLKMYNETKSMSFVKELYDLLPGCYITTKAIIISENDYDYLISKKTAGVDYILKPHLDYQDLIEEINKDE